MKAVGDRSDTVDGHDARATRPHEPAAPEGAHERRGGTGAHGSGHGHGLGPGAKEAAPNQPNQPVQRRTMTRRGVLRLQRSAGNAAVSRMMNRSRPTSAGIGPAAPAARERAPSRDAAASSAGSGTATAAVDGAVTHPGAATGDPVVARTPRAGPPGGEGTAGASATPPADGAPAGRPRGAEMGGEPTALAAPGATVQRLAEAPECAAPPAPPKEVAPQDDPRFTKVTKGVEGAGKALKAHPPAAGEAKAASDAAVAPPGDKEAQAKAAQADKMSGAKPGGFDKAAFIAAVRKAVAAKAPKNLEEADDFASSGKPDQIKAEVKGQVTQGKEASAKDIATKSGEPPDMSKAKDKPVTPLANQPAPRPAVPDAAGAMPAKAPPEQTDLRAGKCDTDAQMAEAEVTEEQLANSNEPEFQGALAAKKQGEEHSATAPADVRQAEAQTLQGAEAGAAQSGQAAVTDMIQGRAGVQAKVGGDKGEAKTKDEAERQRITGEIKKIFDATKTDVDKILNDLDASVDSKFTAGEATAKAAFEADQTARMDRYKEERYSGLTGKARWLKDKLTRMPPEADALFLESKKVYESKMDVVISQIADHIGAELTRAKDRIAKGRDQIAKFVAEQPKALQKVAKDAAGEIGSQFDQLESDVDSKQESLVDDLATKYVEARQAVDDRIKELQDANKGLWEKAKDAVGGVIKTILQLKNMLMGVLTRAAGAIGKIIKDPIGFLGKLIGAVKGGVTRFASNIVEHLKKGLQGWLFGALASAGIEIPDSFDLKGIIKLVLSILGLTWTAIRTKIVKRIGETAMSAVEKGVDIFKTLVTEGIGGLWKFLVDKLSDLKDTVMDAIQDFVVVKIVKAGITWLISALNPAAAFIKACKMIYDVVMFFVEKGSQIKEFVDSVLDSIEEIAGGAVGKVAGFIENTLAKILPLLIGFLASLLGLGGISDKIKEILQKVQKPVSQAVDFVINGALKLARPIINLAKRGAAWAKGKYEKGKAWVKGKYEAGKAKVRGAVDKAKSKLGLGPKERKDEEKKSKDVRTAVNRDLQSTIGGEVDDASSTVSKVQSVYDRHKADGLKSLEIRSTGRAGEFQVLVTASPTAPGTKFVFRDFKVGLSTTELEEIRKTEQDDKSTPEQRAAAAELRGRRMPMTETEKVDPNDPTKVRKSPSGARGQQHTALVAFWNGVPTGRIQSSGKHAEQKLLTLLRAKVGTEGWPNKKEGNQLVIKITKSPCGVCGPLLTKFQQDYKASLALDMEAPHLDRSRTAEGKIPDVKTQEGRAVEVLKTMRQAGAAMGLGVQLTAWDVEEIVTNHYEGPPLDAREKEYIHNKVERMKGILDKVNKELAELDKKKVSG